MMSRESQDTRRYYVAPSEDGWEVCLERSNQRRRFSNKREAVRKARELSESTGRAMLVRNRLGQFSSR